MPAGLRKFRSNQLGPKTRARRRTDVQGRDYRTCGGRAFSGLLASRFQTRAVHRARLNNPPQTLTPDRNSKYAGHRGRRFKPDLPTNLPKIQYARATRGENASRDRQLWQTADSSIRLPLDTLRGSTRIVVVVDGATGPTY